MLILLDKFCTGIVDSRYLKTVPNLERSFLKMYSNILWTEVNR